MASGNLYDFSLNTIDGKAFKLADYRDQVVLLVNVASECGYTPQYEGLEKLHQRYAAQGLVVAGVPSNDFGGQEPGSNAEIRDFCDSKFHVTFPMFEKITVKGDQQHPLYAWLTSNKGAVSWNFNKFLIDRQGQILEHFGSKVEPLSGELVAAIETALAPGAR